MWLVVFGWCVGAVTAFVAMCLLDMRAVTRLLRYARRLEKRVLELERDPGSWEP